MMVVVHCTTTPSDAQKMQLQANLDQGSLQGERWGAKLIFYDFYYSYYFTSTMTYHTIQFYTILYYDDDL